MKRMRTIITTLLLAAFTLTACDKNDDNNTTSITPGIIQSGTWRITLFSDNGTDETSNYTTYTLTFSSNGTVTAVNGIATVNGTWSARTDNSQAKLDLDFGTNPLFSDLNEDWHILEQTAVKVRMEHVSGGGGGTDLLTIERN